MMDEEIEPRQPTGRWGDDLMDEEIEPPMGELAPSAKPQPMGVVFPNVPYEENKGL